MTQERIGIVKDNKIFYEKEIKNKRRSVPDTENCLRLLSLCEFQILFKIKDKTLMYQPCPVSPKADPNRCGQNDHKRLSVCKLVFSDQAYG